MSSEVGLQLTMNAFSSVLRTFVSIDVRFLRLRPIIFSGVVSVVVMELSENTPPVFEIVLSASASHFCSSGFSLHMFLKLRLSASNREIVVCEKSLPYNFPIAKPTSPCVKPSLIRRCLKVLANCSSSSRSVVSSGDWSRERAAADIAFAPTALLFCGVLLKLIVAPGNVLGNMEDMPGVFGVKMALPI